MRASSLCVAACMLVAGQAGALQVNADECREGSEFIRNAALARGNGMTKEAFVARFDDDVVLLSSMPRQVRWFVYGDEEVALLRNAVLDVFDVPRSAAEHASHFLDRCLAAIGAREAPRAQLTANGATAVAARSPR